MDNDNLHVVLAMLNLDKRSSSATYTPHCWWQLSVDRWAEHMRSQVQFVPVIRQYR